jgi:hypothetical protein
VKVPRKFPEAPRNFPEGSTLFHHFPQFSAKLQIFHNFPQFSAKLLFFENFRNFQQNCKFSTIFRTFHHFSARKDFYAIGRFFVLFVISNAICCVLDVFRRCCACH